MDGQMCNLNDVSPFDGSEQDVFYVQSVYTTDRQRERRKCFPVVRVPASQLSQPLSIESVYEHWCETGKIATLQPRWEKAEKGDLDTKTLMAAYRFGMRERHARCADFRDAILDALAEHLDVLECAGWFSLALLLESVENVPETNLERLLVFHTVLSTPPCYFKTLNMEKRFVHHLYNLVTNSLQV